MEGLYAIFIEMARQTLVREVDIELFMQPNLRYSHLIKADEIFLRFDGSKLPTQIPEPFEGRK
jgi:hypothetical protein